MITSNTWDQLYKVTECDRKVMKRVHSGWSGWKRIIGIICDRRMSARMKKKICKDVVKSAMWHGMETVPKTKRQEAELEVEELKTLPY